MLTSELFVFKTRETTKTVMDFERKLESSLKTVFSSHRKITLRDAMSSCTCIQASKNLKTHLRFYSLLYGFKMKKTHVYMCWNWPVKLGFCILWPYLLDFLFLPAVFSIFTPFFCSRFLCHSRRTSSQCLCPVSQARGQWLLLACSPATACSPLTSTPP